MMGLEINLLIAGGMLASYSTYQQELSVATQAKKEAIELGLMQKQVIAQNRQKIYSKRVKE